MVTQIEHQNIKHANQTPFKQRFSHLTRKYLKHSLRILTHPSESFIRIFLSYDLKLIKIFPEIVKMTCYHTTRETCNY